MGRKIGACDNNQAHRYSSHRLIRISRAITFGYLSSSSSGRLSPPWKFTRAKASCVLARWRQNLMMADFIHWNGVPQIFSGIFEGKLWQQPFGQDWAWLLWTKDKQTSLADSFICPVQPKSRKTASFFWMFSATIWNRSLANQIRKSSSLLNRIKHLHWLAADLYSNIPEQTTTHTSSSNIEPWSVFKSCRVG